MRVTHILFNMITGGAETLLIDIMRHQAAAGHDVSLLLINDRHDARLMATIDPRIKVEIIGKPQGSRNPLWLLRFNRRLRAMRPDAVHVHNERALGMLRRELCGRHFKLLFTYHCTGCINPWSGRPDLSCAISEAVAQDVMSRGLLPADAISSGRLAVVPNGIMAETIAVRPDGAPHRPLRLVQVGRLDPRTKGQDLTLRALAMLPADEYKLTFIGDGAGRDELAALARELGVDGRVDFRGTLSRREVYAELAHYDVALLTSRSEGFGLTLAEAAAAGLPIVSCDLPGPLEVVDGGRLATTFSTGSAEALARAIAGVAGAWPKAEERARQARKYVAERFSIASTADTYLRLYNS